MLFFVKVKIDINKLPELAQKLENGELDKRNIKLTYCIKDDPTVGLNIWEAADNESFEKAFEPHKAYYKEIIEVTPIIPVEESKTLLMKGFR